MELFYVFHRILFVGYHDFQIEYSIIKEVFKEKKSLPGGGQKASGDEAVPSRAKRLLHPA
jgi:hypothetical protein